MKNAYIILVLGTSLLLGGCGKSDKYDQKLDVTDELFSYLNGITTADEPGPVNIKLERYKGKSIMFKELVIDGTSTLTGYSVTARTDIPKNSHISKILGEETNDVNIFLKLSKEDFSKTKKGAKISADCVLSSVEMKDDSYARYGEDNEISIHTKGECENVSIQ